MAIGIWLFSSHQERENKGTLQVVRFEQDEKVSSVGWSLLGLLIHKYSMKKKAGHSISTHPIDWVCLFPSVYFGIFRTLPVYRREQ